MAKVGRNDPCPCGSGRKYKQCCIDGPQSKGLRLPDYLDPKEIARRWMGEGSGAKQPVRDVKGQPLRLVLDRFTVEDAKAVTKVRALGKSEEDRLLFFEGDQWIGEADFSVAHEMQLISPSEELADRLRSLVDPISGLRFMGRQTDDFAELTATGPLSGGAELLQFKKVFFKAWPDESNEKLDGMTPRDAAKSVELQPRLRSLVRELEMREAELPKKERYGFKGLKAELGL